jgi:hypothetical protein
VYFNFFPDLEKSGIEFYNPQQPIEKSVVWCFEFPSDDFKIAKFFQAAHPSNGVSSVSFSQK